ncbi:MAG: aminotransferase class V-fold PLP-dependent enzyme [Melioribacteraceae bacterium]|nr:aminotransferase class V-fold PLP-dependent enzyme [Melioribacteraceae bacterium]
MRIEEIRNLFPHIKTGQIYFNNAATGPWSTLVYERIQEYYKQRSEKLIENDKYYLMWSSNAKAKLGKMINASPDRIAWVDNVSNGLNILAQGLNWKPGDRVVINDIEFPSNVYPFLNLKQYGVEVDIVKSRNGIVDAEDIERLITPTTKLVTISQVQFLSGYRADLDKIGELCKKHGIIFCVDSIQGAGAVKFDVIKSQIDFLCGGTQKWLMSSQGLSYIYITEELQNRIIQKNVGWLSVENEWDLLNYDLSFKSTAERFQNGTVNVLGVSIFDAVLDLFIEFGIENCELRVIDNSNYLMNELNKLDIVPVLNGLPDKNLSGIVSFKHSKAREIFEELEKRKINCAVREGMVRFAPHFFNTHEDIDQVIDELKRLI